MSRPVRSPAVATGTGSDGQQVLLPSGATLDVLTDDEADYVTSIAASYQEQFMFESISDIQELDRLVAMELQCHRYHQWVSRGKKYDDKPIDDQQLNRAIRDHSTEIRLIKKTLGIDRVSREKERGLGSVHQFIHELLTYAREFGLHRVEQLDLGLELINQVISLAILWDNCTPEERSDMGYTAEEILRWILETAKPEYEALDAYFQVNTARYYVLEVINPP